MTQFTSGFIQLDLIGQSLSGRVRFSSETEWNDVLHYNEVYGLELGTRG